MRAGHQVGGVDGVADRRRGGDGEHGSDVERVGAADHGFLDLAVDTESLQCHRQALHGPRYPRETDRSTTDGSALADHQVSVRGVRAVPRREAAMLGRLAGYSDWLPV